MELEAYAHRLPDPPFAAPAQWAAFYVTGRPDIEFEEAARMNLDDLAGRTRPLDEPGLPVLRLERDDEVAGVVAWFGEDRARRVVHLIVRGEDAGCLFRTDLYDLMGTRSMGFGDSGAHDPAGRVDRPGGRSQLECPEPGCAESPLYALRFDPAAPPHCRLHPERALAPR